MLGQRVSVILGAAGLCAAMAFVGCGDDEPPIDPTGAGGTATTTTTTSATTTTVAVTTTTGGGPASFVGQACTSDAACGNEEGARCVTSGDDEPAFSIFASDVTGGPAGGYCTKNCDSDADCPSDSACANNICMMRCTSGEPPIMYLDDQIPANKCHGRDDLMCVTLTNAGDVCLPVCGHDSECGGRQCDHRAVLCVDEARQGLQLGGGPCVQNNQNTPEDEDACGGFCLNFVDSASNVIGHMCTKRCGWGGDFINGVDLDCGGPLNGLCLYAPSGTGVGDDAFCTGACSSHDQCNWQEGVFCDDVANLASIFDTGYCRFRFDGVCVADADCEANEKCLDTASGKWCIQVDASGDPIFPLGDADPGAGAGGAGGAGGTGGAGGAGGAGGTGGGGSAP